MTRGGESLAAIGRLRRLADALLKQKDEDAAWFKAALMVYEAGDGDGVTLCRAFGLAPTPGRDGWRSSEARSKRDALLCEIVRRFYPDEASERCCAAKIASRLRQFAAGARLWRPGRLEELLHYVIAIGLPTSSRTVQRALATGRLCQALPRVAGTDAEVSKAHDRRAPQATTATAD